MARPRIVALIPTYNEPELVRACVASLLVQDPVPEILVINAGDPIPGLDPGVTVLPVRKEAFWTECMHRGLEAARNLAPDFILLSNADTYFLPGTLAHLLELADADSRVIAASPGYEMGGDAYRLRYSRQMDLGFLLYGRLIRDWNLVDEAPEAPFDSDLMGGQGVLVPFAAFDHAEFRWEIFPQYAGDHDLWLQMRAHGWRIRIHPKAGIVNRRQFNEQRRGSRLRALWWRWDDVQSGDSWRTMAALRLMHQPLGLALLSFLVSFGLRWTVGLPKMLRRS